MAKSPFDFRYDVFLSHSAEDRAAVSDIAERLKSAGLRVWFDAWFRYSGDGALAKIEELLEHSRVLVLCVSANAFGPDWAQLEAGTFRFRDPQDKERRFIPLSLDATPTKGSLAQFLHIRWFSEQREQEYANLLDACRPPPRGVPASSQPASGRLRGTTIKLNCAHDISDYAFSPDGERVLTSAADYTVRLWNWRTGRCLRVFEGHTRMFNVAWLADERRFFSSCDDKTVRVWDVETGHCLRVLEGHTGPVRGLALSTDQRYAISASFDGSLRLWDTQNGACLRVFRGHTGAIIDVTCNADGSRTLSASHDNTLRLWEVATGRCLLVLVGHTGGVECVAYSSDQRYALSAARDNTVRMWDLETGRCLRVLEGHPNLVRSVAWSSKGHLALSGGDDSTVRLWDMRTGRCLRISKGHLSWVVTVAWSPDQRCAWSGDKLGLVQMWDLAEIISEAGAAEQDASTLPPLLDQNQYTNAKVLLVGDTGVGKSGLAGRLVHKQFVPTKSSHARKAHVLESKIVKEPSGVSLHQETVLWDLAGQPAYRLVHQLSLEDAAIACVLFDCRHETNPFEGATYWSRVLDQARTNTPIRKLLIASRIDVGGLPAGKDRIEAFARENGFVQFIPTSASTGEGCDELVEAIRQGIPWNQLPKVTTTFILAAIRDYVARLKGEKGGVAMMDGQPITPLRLFTISELHEGFVSHFGKKISSDEFITHLQRLEATDAVDLLVFYTIGAEPGPDTLVLLDPTRVDAYASALLVAAKDEPDGPGHLLESRVRDGKFKLGKDERIPDPNSERHLLWFVMESLLSRDLALRERIRGKDYVVFPSQCTAELRFPGVAAFGVAFTFAGPVRSIYATLIAQLAHYEGFKSRKFFQDAAAYDVEAGGRCLVRLRDYAQGQAELDVSFEGDTPPPTRQGFLEFIANHLHAKSTPGSVTPRHAYHCANMGCRKPFDDAVVKANLAAKRKDLLCPYCREKSRLVDLLAEPNAAAESVATQIDTDAKVGRHRMTAALVIKAKEAEGKFDIFLSHNSKDKAAVEKIARRLLRVGLRPWFDKWNLSPGDTVSDALERAIKDIPCAALCFGPADTGKWHIMEIRGYFEKWASGAARMIPVILPTVDQPPDLPLFIRQTLWVDMRNWEAPESDGFYRLVCGILGKAPGDSPLKKFGVRDVTEWQGMNCQ